MPRSGTREAASRVPQITCCIPTATARVTELMQMACTTHAVRSCDFGESYPELPAPIADGLALEEAKAIRQKFEAVGAVCSISVMNFLSDRS
jgi:hypothetical protein